MSYLIEKREEFLNEYFSRLADFYRLAPRLLQSSSDEEFELWFEKLEQIDKRSLYLYIKKFYQRIPIRRLKLIKDRFDYKFIK